MQITVDNKVYNIEFTFEAAESDCIQKVFDFFTGAYQYRGLTSLKDENDMSDTEKAQSMIKLVDSTLNEAASIPGLTIDFLYTGLLEHHGACGDITQDILTRDDAKRLYKQFCKENPDDERAMHTGMFDALKEQMKSDGFFKRIGLEQMLESMNKTAQEQAEKVTTIVPQDHKRKYRKA